MSCPFPHCQVCREIEERAFSASTCPLPTNPSLLSQFEIPPFPIRSLLWLWKVLCSGSLDELLQRAQHTPWSLVGAKPPGLSLQGSVGHSLHT